MIILGTLALRFDIIGTGLGILGASEDSGRIVLGTLTTCIDAI